MCMCCRSSREQAELSPPRLLAVCLLSTCRISTRRQVTGCTAVGLTPLINPSDCTTVDEKLRISHPIISLRQLATVSPLKFSLAVPFPRVEVSAEASLHINKGQSLFTPHFHEAVCAGRAGCVTTAPSAALEAGHGVKKKKVTQREV